VREQLTRTRLGILLLLVSSGLAVSGIALIVGAMGARVFFGRSSTLADGFAATVVMLSALAAGRAVPPAVIRILSGQPGLPTVPSASGQGSGRIVPTARS
jgi:hypothetical protein